MICIGASAQLKLGVNTSYNLSLESEAKLSLIQKGYKRYSIDYKGVDNSFSYGLAGYADNSRLYFMTGLNYQAQTTRLSAMDRIEGRKGMQDFTLKTQSLHVPFTAGVKFSKFRIGVGPDFIYELDRQEGLSKYPGITMKEPKLRSGFHFQLGFDPIKQVKLSLGYQMAFYKMSDDYRFDMKPIKLNSTPRALTFNVAVFL